MRALPHHCRQTGFTLLELLLVILVAGIMAGLAVMSVGGNTEREFRRDVARMQQVLRMAADEAQFNAKELGLWIAPDGSAYGFYTFDEAELEWVPYEAEGFRNETLPVAYQLQLALQGEPLDLAQIYRDALHKDDKLEGLGDQPFSPLLIFFSDGDYTPFRLWIRHPDVAQQAYVLTGDGLGDIHSDVVDMRNVPAPKDDE